MIGDVAVEPGDVEVTETPGQGGDHPAHSSW
jgi:hypothetical protein